MELGELISFYRRRSGMTIDELAEKSGVPKSTINKIIGGMTKSPSLDNVKSIAKAMGLKLADFDNDPELADMFSISEQEIIKKYRLLDPDWKEAVDNILNIGYQASTSAPHTEPPRHLEQEKIIYIFPGYSMPMSAGTGQPAGDDSPEEFELKKRPPRGTSFIAPVSGDSMEPEFHNGDFVFVRAQYEVEIGKVGVFFMDGQQWIKERGDKELISYNPKYEPIPMQEGTICQGLVLGVCDESYFEQ